MKTFLNLTCFAIYLQTFWRLFDFFKIHVVCFHWSGRYYAFISFFTSFSTKKFWCRRRLQRQKLTTMSFLRMGVSWRRHPLSCSIRLPKQVVQDSQRSIQFRLPAGEEFVGNNGKDPTSSYFHLHISN